MKLRSKLRSNPRRRSLFRSLRLEPLSLTLLRLGLGSRCPLALLRCSGLLRKTKRCGGGFSCKGGEEERARYEIRLHAPR